MKKLPWKLFAWICVEVAFFLTFGIVVAFLILNGIAGATSGGITLFTNWWQTLLFVADILFVGSAVACFVMHFRTKKAANVQITEEQQ